VFRLLAREINDPSIIHLKVQPANQLDRSPTTMTLLAIFVIVTHIIFRFR
jgi:hypothetical protein